MKKDRRAFGKKVFSGSWLMLLVLSIIPAIFLMWDWDPDGEKISQKRNSDRIWLSETDSTSEMFKAASSPEYWIKFAAAQLNSFFLANVSSEKSIESSIALLPKALKLKFTPDFLLWGFSFSTKKQVKMLTSSGFQKDKKYFLEKLFLDIARQEMGEDTGFGSSNWNQRLKALFGKMVSEKLFYKRFSGIPFPVIYDGKPYLLLWECLKNPETGNVAGGYLLLQPVSEKERLLPLELIIANWNLIDKGNGVYPAYAPLTMEGFQNIVFHKSIAGIKSLEKDIKELLLQNFEWKKNTGYDKSGSVKLPGSIVGRVLDVGKYRVRVCVLSSLCGHLGLIISERPKLPETFRLKISKAYAWIVGAFWLLFMSNRFIFGQTSSFSLKIRLSFWFLAFCAVPAGLSFGTWSALLQGFKDGRMRELQGALEKQLSDFEVRSGKIQARMQRACQLLVEDKRFSNECFELQQKPWDDQKILGRWEKFLGENGLETDGILTAIQGGWLFKKYNPKTSSDMGSAATNILGAVIGAYLEQASPNKNRKPLLNNVSQYKDKRVPQFAGVDDSKLYENADYIRESFGRVVLFDRGNDVFLHYYHPVYRNAELFGIALFAKNAIVEYERILPEMVYETAVEFRQNRGLSVDFVIFRNDGNGLRSIAKAGNIKGLKDIARLSGDTIVRKFSKDGVEVAMPTVRIPGYVIAIRAPDYLILQAVDIEKLLVFFSILSLILILFLGLQGFSYWIVSPILQMRNQLRKVRNGEFCQDFNYNRQDEFGFVGKKLNSMVNWLLERKGVSRFVSPQVMNVIEEKNLIKAGAGTFQNAIILVSDIRSFTTISERETSEEVFEMVNTHLGATSEIIENYGGIIDRFVGDAVWAVFYENEGALPFKNALNASIGIMNMHNKIQEDREAGNKFKYKIGVGIDFGKVLSGVIGDATFRLDFSVVGETLHEAESLEGLSKLSRYTGIVVSQRFEEMFSDHKGLFSEIDSTYQAKELVSLEGKL